MTAKSRPNSQCQLHYHKRSGVCLVIGESLQCRYYTANWAVSSPDRRSSKLHLELVKDQLNVVSSRSEWR